MVMSRSAMGASMTVMVMAVVRTVVSITVTGPAVTAASDGGANEEGGTVCEAAAAVVGCAKGVVSGIRGGRIPKLRWLGM
jgi:hypothetical protein